MSLVLPAYSAATGTHYFTARNAAGQWWNGSAFEAYGTSAWSFYVISATSVGVGNYTSSFDDLTTVATLHLRAGVSAASSDVVIDFAISQVSGGGSDGGTLNINIEDTEVTSA